jgi:hypothetical protein
MATLFGDFPPIFADFRTYLGTLSNKAFEWGAAVAQR